MTYQQDFTLPVEILEQISEQGFEFLPALIQLIVNAAMYAERQQYLQAAPYQRTPERRSYANGYKPKTVNTRVGKITFSVPQTRDGDFYPSALEKGLRSERALTLALAEMYVQGVSTRKVKAITEELCGVSVSSSQVSKASALLDEELEKWRNRSLGEYPYLYLDAHYEHVREDGQVRDLAVFTAIGVNLAGKREILGVSVSLSEHEVHWRTVPAFNFPVALRIIGRGANMRHAALTNKLLEGACHKLGSVIGDNSRRGIGETFLGAQQDDFHVRLRHLLPKFPVDDVAAVAIQNRAEIIKVPGQVDVRNIDMPMLVGFCGLVEARTFFGGFSCPFSQHSSLF